MKKSALTLLVVFFLAGAVCGTALAFFSQVSGAISFISTQTASVFSLRGFFSSLYSASWLLLIAVFLSTSTLGHVLIPFLAFFRGYLLSCCLAVMLSDPSAQVEMCLLVVGLPALFSIPAFFLLCEDGIMVARLVRLCSRSGFAFHSTGPESSRLFASAILLLASAFVQQFLIPHIL